jgi:hypothetical protein
MNVLPDGTGKELTLEFKDLAEFEAFFDAADAKGSFELSAHGLQKDVVIRARVSGSPRTRKIKPAKITAKGSTSIIHLVLNEESRSPNNLPESIEEKSSEPSPDINSQPEVGQSQFDKIRALTMTERVALALKADLMDRRILMQENNSKINEFLLRNVRITEQEIAFMAKNAAVPMQNLLMIAGNRALMNHEPIRIAVLTNPRTPAAMVMDMIPTLSAIELSKMNQAPYLREDVKASVKREMKKRGIKSRENL